MRQRREINYPLVAFTPPVFLNRREWRLQSQPQNLQYHSVMPSHSSRSARMARPVSMECWSAGVMGEWITGMTWSEPHSGQIGVFRLRGDFCARFAVRFGTATRLDAVILNIRVRDRTASRQDATAR